MSVKVMGLVWDLDIPRNQKYVLLAYADHADHNGKNIFPSIDLIADKTGYDSRSVKRITRSLRESGYLVPDGKGPKGTNKWKIPLDMGGVKMSPPDVGSNHKEKGVTKNTEGVTKNTEGGDIAVSPEPSLTVIEPSKNLNTLSGEEKNKLRADALDLWLEIAGGEIPEKKGERVARFYNPIRTICDLGEWEWKKVDWLIRATHKRMDGLTYDAPDQWIKTMKGILREVRNGTYQKSGQPKGFEGGRQFLSRRG